MSSYEGNLKNSGKIDVFEVPTNLGLLTDVAFWKDLFSDLHHAQRTYATGLTNIVNKLTRKYDEERHGGKEADLFNQMVEDLRDRLEHNACVVSSESDISKDKLDRLTAFIDKSASEKKLKTLKHQCSKAQEKYKKLYKKMEKNTQKFESYLTTRESLPKDAQVTDKYWFKIIQFRVDALVKRYHEDAELEEKLRQDMMMKCKELETAWADLDKPKATTIIKNIVSRKSARNYDLNTDRLFEEIANSSTKTTRIHVYKEALLHRYEKQVKRELSESLHDTGVHSGSGGNVLPRATVMAYEDRIHNLKILKGEKIICMHDEDQLSSRISQTETGLNANFSSRVNNEPDVITETKDVTKLGNFGGCFNGLLCKNEDSSETEQRNDVYTTAVCRPSFLCFGGRRSRRGLYPAHIVPLAVD